MSEDTKTPDTKPAEAVTEVVVEEPVDRWSEKQRELINQILASSTATECDKVSTFPTFNIKPDALSKEMENLFNKHNFDVLKSHTCVDWIEEGEFELLYLLFSTTHLDHIWVSTRVSRENPVINTVSNIYPVAEFQEREVYDLFGVQFGGNKDLRRIFLDDDWEGYPLRKDYKDDFMLEKP